MYLIFVEGNSRMDFTSRQLQAYLLVAQHQSFARAAEALFITPSGLSVLIRELENHVGFRLFDRTTRHVALTAEGSRFLATIQKCMDEISAAASNLGDRARRTGQTLSVGAHNWAAAHILPQAIKEFRTRRPELQIRLFDGDLSSVCEMVKHGELDMAFGFFKKLPDLRRTPFFRFSLIVLRPQDDAAPRRASTTWSALKGEQLLSLPSASPIQRVIDKHLEGAGVAREAAIVLNQADTLLAMVEAGQGIAILPSTGLAACRTRRVVASRLINPTVTMDWCHIQNRGRKLPPTAEEFTFFLQGYIARWAGRSGVL
jgi:DNA-binding transcriptional LysR family regulator